MKVFINIGKLRKTQSGGTNETVYDGRKNTNSNHLLTLIKLLLNSESGICSSEGFGIRKFVRRLQNKNESKNVYILTEHFRIQSRYPVTCSPSCIQNII